MNIGNITIYAKKLAAMFGAEEKKTDMLSHLIGEKVVIRDHKAGLTDLMKKLQRPLEAHEIDFRIQSINKGGYATILAYKDARVDMKRLDEVFGVHGWQRDYKTVNGLLMCGVSIKYEGEWITKWDVGTESDTEKEKGHASDAFKRACFNFGIGRELYDYPEIKIQLNKDEWEIRKKGNFEKPCQTYNLRLNEWAWKTQFTEHGKLNYIAAGKHDGQQWITRFKWRVPLNEEKAK